ncbi:MAG: hypothetical protein JSU66_03925 [Deltaproteobacteria bacterium]|nr:MAG: hypothetical protein JSU66_03925 [Deltaproteobacteria bacterium]
MRRMFVALAGVAWLMGHTCAVLCAVAPTASADAPYSHPAAHAAPMAHAAAGGGETGHRHAAPVEHPAPSPASERDGGCGTDRDSSCCPAALEALTASAGSAFEPPARAPIPVLRDPAVRSLFVAGGSNRPCRRDLRDPRLPVDDLLILQSVFRL